MKSGVGRKILFIAVVVVIAWLGLKYIAQRPEVLPAGVGLEACPLEVSYRGSFLGKGLVAQIHNPTGRTLRDVYIECVRNGASVKKFLEESWAPGRTQNLGWSEGFQFQEGDSLVLSAAGFRERTWRMPGK